MIVSAGPLRIAQFTPSGPRPVRVIVCDDSAVIRSVFCRLLDNDQDITIVGRACNGKEALDIIKAQPDIADVLILDIEMPVMDGLTALPLLLSASSRLRVIIASTLTTRGAVTTLEALRLGAVDYVAKPSASALAGDLTFQRELLGRVKSIGHRPSPCVASTMKSIKLRSGETTRPRLLAVGSSTGGPQALVVLLQSLRTHLGPAGLKIPVVVTQHMPATFTALLAEQLTRLCGIPSIEAVDGAVLQPGCVHIAPGGKHLLVTRGSGDLIGRLDHGPAENFCRPSVDPMLRSATQACEGRVLLIMLTGMGQDGLGGTETLVAAGGVAFAQDEESSVVWGMPGAIARAGYCHAVLPIPLLAERAAQHIRGAI